jgi:hypothetical protein
MYKQMPRKMLCVGRGGVERGELTRWKTYCKQSLEEGMIVAKKVHGGELARLEVASSKVRRAMVSQNVQTVLDDGQYRGSYHHTLLRRI